MRKKQTLLQESTQHSAANLLSPSSTNGCTLAIRGIRQHLGCGLTKANQIVASGVLPTFVIGRNRYARRSDIERLTELFASPEAQAALSFVQRRARDSAGLLDRVELLSRVAPDGR